ncbi:aKG-HExxH-type peptide beta-hydroxylase [Nocardia camponoti]|uniref:HEXXH motif domain-containing protein n=1 Tax=Nocardia camponoti TaxID=1616106 RepID=A0A917V3W1_9NOCA|nr:HEXXH motif-containing putative peptide modification protein [Nocardia camponoti]GGK33958.1 hypothetical protein GCM10011591_02050 [Nocardia camponoti]
MLTKPEIENLFSAVPDASRSAVLRTRMNEQLLSDLAKYTTIAAKVFPVAAERVEAILPVVDPTAKLSPLLYVIHHDVRNGLQNQNAPAVGSALSRLIGAIEKGSGSAPSRLTAGNIVGDALDGSLIETIVRELPADGDGQLAQVLPARSAEYRRARRWFEEGLTVMQDVDPELFGELGQYGAELRLFTGTHARGVTSVKAFGQILLRVPDESEYEQGPLYFLDHITHETSHLALHSMMNVDRLISNGFTSVHDAPIRKDKRPLYGIYHATFVLSRIVRVLARVAKQVPSERCDRLRDIQLERFRKGHATVMGNAELTVAGRAVMDSCARLVEDAIG